MMKCGYSAGYGSVIFFRMMYALCSKSLFCGKSENLAGLSRAKLYLECILKYIFFMQSCRRMYCMSKFQIIFVCMQCEKCQWNSLILFNIKFAVGNLQLLSQLFNQWCSWNETLYWHLVSHKLSWYRYSLFKKLRVDPYRIWVLG